MKSLADDLWAFFSENPKPNVRSEIRPYYQSIADRFGTSYGYVKKTHHKWESKNNTVSQTLESNGLDGNNWKHAWVKDKTCSVFLRNASGDVSYDDVREELIEAAKNHAPKYPKIERKEQGEHLLIVDPSDLHIGKLALVSETGELYNVQEAVKRAREGVEGLISKSQGYSIGKVCFVIGNDVLHIDNPKRTTTSGTPQDTDSMWWDCWIKARELYVDLIERLLSIADVHVVYCPSNHDFTQGFMLAESLYAWFHNSDNVTFNVSMSHRKFMQYGVNMLMFDHGDGHKVQDTPIIMASQEPNMWAATKLRYSYKHHLHHKQRINWLTEKDYHGCTVEFLRSPSSADRWHDTNGFTFVPRALEAFIHHPTQGQVARITHYF